MLIKFLQKKFTKLIPIKKILNIFFMFTILIILFKMYKDFNNNNEDFGDIDIFFIEEFFLGENLSNIINFIIFSFFDDY